MKAGACNARVFEPFHRVVAGPCTPDDLQEAEQFARAVVLHDDIRMLPEHFRITVDEDERGTVSPLLVKTEGFETFGHYFDPYFVETPHGRELLENTYHVDSDRRVFFDPFRVSLVLALEQICAGGSAVVRDSAFQMEVVRNLVVKFSGQTGLSLREARVCYGSKLAN